MSENEPESEDGFLVARIVIERWLDQDGADTVRWTAENSQGDELTKIEQCGMLYMTLDGALHAPDE